MIRYSYETMVTSNMFGAYMTLNSLNNGKHGFMEYFSKAGLKYLFETKLW